MTLPRWPILVVEHNLLEKGFKVGQRAPETGLAPESVGELLAGSRAVAPMSSRGLLRAAATANHAGRTKIPHFVTEL